MGIHTYHALLIGVQDYPSSSGIPDLATPRKDIAAVAEVLRDRYGFEVVTLVDGAATRAGILDALDRMRLNLGDSDALLVYWAGHGTYDDVGHEGYWLPQDARADSRANWISNSDLATRMLAMQARHVLLLADSCFAGAVFRDFDPARAVPGLGDETAARRLAGSRSRWVITSGGREPVVDGYREGMSVFAYFLARQLQDATARYVEPDALFAGLREGVVDNANQTPQQGPFKGTGHEGGQLVMVNRGAIAAPPADVVVVPAPAAPATPPPTPPPMPQPVTQASVPPAATPPSPVTQGSASPVTGAPSAGHASAYDDSRNVAEGFLGYRPDIANGIWLQNAFSMRAWVQPKGRFRWIAAEILDLYAASVTGDAWTPSIRWGLFGAPPAWSGFQLLAGLYGYNAVCSEDTTCTTTWYPGPSIALKVSRDGFSSSTLLDAQVARIEVVDDLWMEYEVRAYEDLTVSLTSLVGLDGRVRMSYAWIPDAPDSRSKRCRTR